MVPSGRGLACGLQDQRLMARPPARAGGRSGLLTGGKSGKSKGFSLPSPKGHLPTPPARPAGGRAVTSVPMRGPQARLQSDQPPSPVFPTREWGSKGKEPPSPWCSFPYFSKEIGPRPGGPSSPPVPTAMEKAPHPPARRASPHSPSGEVFLWEQLKKILNIPLLVS